MKLSKGLKLFDVVIAGLSGAIGVEIFVLLNYAYFHLAEPPLIQKKSLTASSKCSASKATQCSTPSWAQEQP